MNSFYVYVYRDSAGNPFYVGKGKGKRYKDHVRECRRLKNRRYHIFFYNKLRKMIRLGEKFTIEIFKGDLLESEAFEWEKFLIAFWGRRDIGTGCLCNHSEGGEGVSGRVCSEETRQKMSEIRLGMKFSEEHCRHLGEAKKNPPKETREKMAKAKKISILALDVITKEELIKFESLTDAAQFFEISSVAISRALRGKAQISAGCRWKYSGEHKKKRSKECCKKYSKCNNKPVVLLDIITCEDLICFESTVDAASFLGVHFSGINAALRGKAKTSAGCKWRYA